MANCHSSGHWQPEQSMAMALSTVMLKAGRLRCWSARFLLWLANFVPWVPGGLLIDLPLAIGPFKLPSHEGTLFGILRVCWAWVVQAAKQFPSSFHLTMETASISTTN
jgi:hypothetical protein